MPTHSLNWLVFFKTFAAVIGMEMFGVVLAVGLVLLGMTLRKRVGLPASVGITFGGLGVLYAAFISYVMASHA